MGNLGTANGGCPHGSVVSQVVHRGRAEGDFNRQPPKDADLVAHATRLVLQLLRVTLTL